MTDMLSIGHIELVNQQEADDGLRDLVSVMAEGRLEGTDKSLSSIPELMDYVAGMMRITHQNFVTVYVCKHNYQTRESLNILKADPDINIRFLSAMGRTNVIYDGMDVITLSHNVPINSSIDPYMDNSGHLRDNSVDHSAILNSDWSKLSSEIPLPNPHPKKYLLETIKNALESMGYSVSNIEEPNKIHLSMLDHYLNINGKTFATTSVIKTDIDTLNSYQFETVLITYDYDADLYRKCLTDKELYREIQGCGISSPDDVIIDNRYIKYTGLIQEFPNFDIDVFRKQLFIEITKKLDVDLIMKEEIKKKFFDKEAMPFVTPKPEHKVFKYSSASLIDL